MRSHAKWIGLLIGLSVLWTGCRKETPLPGTPVTFETFCDPKYDPTDDKGLSVTKRVTIEGYLRPQKLFTLCSSTCSLDLYPQPGGKGTPIFASFTIGNDNNEMEKLPDPYKDSDIKLRTLDGKPVGVDARVRVTGGRLGSAKEHRCQLYHVDRIELP